MWKYSTRPVYGVLTRDPVAGGTAGATWRAKREYCGYSPAVRERWPQSRSIHDSGDVWSNAEWVASRPGVTSLWCHPPRSVYTACWTEHQLKHTLKYLLYCDDVRYWLKTLCARCVANVCDNMADRDIALPFNGILSSTELYSNLQLRWEDTGERGESVGFGLCFLLPFRSHSYLWWNLYFV
jgi:hypothetical protein